MSLKNQKNRKNLKKKKPKEPKVPKELKEPKNHKEPKTPKERKEAKERKGPKAIKTEATTKKLFIVCLTLNLFNFQKVILPQINHRFNSIRNPSNLSVTHSSLTNSTCKL